ncbi:MAG TPA: hypothetical protein PLL26_03530 [Candidatus Dojkabacteria bacterium]|nr:hypothetical protein [Candidatus Dojkabacteria bacterium]
MENKDTNAIVEQKSNGSLDAVACLVIELIGGILFFMPGLGHVLSGRVLQGFLILVGGYLFGIASGFIGILTLGCTYVFSIPIYLAGVIYSAVSVFRYMEHNNLKADWKSFLIYIGIIIGIIVILAGLIVFVSAVLPMIFIAFSNN